MTSTNGIDWTATPSGTPVQLQRVLFAGGRFVAGGEHGTLLWSDDGLTWSKGSSSISEDVYALGYGMRTNLPSGGLYVAWVSYPFDFSAIALTSIDGKTWFTNSVPSVSANFGLTASICFGNNRFLAAPSQGSTLFISGNGTNWSESPSNVSEGPVAFGNNLFVSAMRFNGTNMSSRTSTNGFTWSATPNGAYSPNALYFGGGRFVSVGQYGGQGHATFSAGPAIGTSTDGTNWFAQYFSGDATLRGVCYGGGVYVAVGNAGLIFSSEDGISWTRRSRGVTHTLYGVAPARDGFVAAGNSGTVALSTNGSVWEEFSAPLTNILFAALHSSGRFVFAGSAGTILSGPEVTNLTVCSSGTSGTFVSLAFGANRFVAVGNAGLISTSDDSLHWSLQNSGVTAALQKVVFGKDTFVAIGSARTILTSRDGINWTPRESPVANEFGGIAFGNGRFVALCNGLNTNGQGAVSEDGIVWKAIPPFGNAIRQGFGNGVFIAQDAAVEPSIFPVDVSSDGIHWQKFPKSIYSPFLTAMAFNNGTFITVGEQGLILQSGPVVHLTSTFDGLAHVSIEGINNATYRIESLEPDSSSAEWQERATISSAPYDWTDPQSATASNRLYRALFVP